MTLKEQALKLYMLSFPEDSEQFAKTFIERFFDKNCRYVLENETMVSMLFLFDCDIIAEGRSVKSKYLYAAATHPDFRKKGYMTKLIGRVTKEAKEPIITKPANKELFAFYGSCGFKDAFYFSESLYEKQKTSEFLLEQTTADEYKSIREKLLNKIPHVSLGNFGDMELSSLLLLKGEDTCCAVDLDGEIPTVKEIISQKSGVQDAVLEFINKPKAFFRTTCFSEVFAMLFLPDKTNLPAQMYMGLAMD